MKVQQREISINARASPSSDVQGYSAAKNIMASPVSDDFRRNAITMRLATWNIGSLTGRSQELAEVLQRRKINICCIQELRWKGSKSRNIGNGYQLLYHGSSNARNGVGIVVDEQLKQRIISVDRHSDRIMSLKLALDNQPCLNIISVYAPQTGCTKDEKTSFWEDLQEFLLTFPASENKIIAATYQDEQSFEGKSTTALWDDYKRYTTDNAKASLGVSKGKVVPNKDPSWWNNDVKVQLAEKKERFKEWQKSNDDRDRENYVQAKKKAKKVVAKSRAAADESVYHRLENAVTDKEIFKIANYRNKQSQDIKHNKYIRNSSGTLLTLDKDINKRWFEYYNTLLNEEFPQDAIDDIPPISTKDFNLFLFILCRRNVERFEALADSPDEGTFNTALFDAKTFDMATFNVMHIRCGSLSMWPM
ncbi:hypothetical protein NE865_04417 [Phthorimaea operculella]|nr:hypothetical protein NE865_04417 [Phthorimaea operculella]